MFISHKSTDGTPVSFTVYDTTVYHYNYIIAITHLDIWTICVVRFRHDHILHSFCRDIHFAEYKCMRGAFCVVSTNQHLVFLIPKPNTEGIIYRRCLLSARDFRANDRTSPIHNIMAAGMYWTLD